MSSKIRYLTGFIYLLFTMASCNDPDAPDCFKTIGNTIELDIPVEYFYRINVNDDIDLYLKNGPESKITVRGGENLLPKLKVTFADGILTFENNNTCNWTRKYDRIQVYLTSPSISEIWHFGFGNIVSLDTLRSDYLLVKCQFSSGDINLVVNTPKFYCVSNSVSLINISGNTKRAQIGYYFNDGIFNGEQLNADTVLVDHKGYSRIRVEVNYKLTGQILQNGTLEYITNGSDLDVDVDVEGKAKLIKIGS